MRNALRTAAVALAMTVAVASLASAQDRPDFSGTWTLAQGGGPGGFGGGPGGPGRGPGGPGGPGGMGPQGGMFMAMGGLGPGAQIVQDANTLTIVRTTPMGEFRQAYRLDGSESRNTIGMGGNQIELVSRAAWEGETLVIVTPIEFGNMSGESRIALSLDDSGALVVETTRTGGQAGPRTVSATYTRE